MSTVPRPSWTAYSDVTDPGDLVHLIPNKYRSHSLFVGWMAGQMEILSAGESKQLTQDYLSQKSMPHLLPCSSHPLQRGSTRRRGARGKAAQNPAQPCSFCPQRAPRSKGRVQLTVAVGRQRVPEETRPRTGVFLVLHSPDLVRDQEQ